MIKEIRRGDMVMHKQSRMIGKVDGMLHGDKEEVMVNETGPYPAEDFEKLVCLSEVQAELKTSEEVRQAVVRRVQELEGRLQDAIGAIEHSQHPVAMQWLPALTKTLRGG